MKVEVLRAFMDKGITHEIGSVIELPQERVTKLIQRRMVREYKNDKKTTRAIGVGKNDKPLENRGEG